MNLKELRNKQGRLSGVIVTAENIEELQNSLKPSSKLVRDLNAFLAQQGEDRDDIMLNGLTVAETNLKLMKRTEILYKDAFAKGAAMYYRDERCQSPKSLSGQIRTVLKTW